MKECSVCLFTDDFAKIHDDGVCEYCKLQETLAKQAGDFAPVLAEIKKKGKGKQYDSLIGISGGADSSILLYMAVKKWGLRPLVIHMDNGWNNAEAENNMKVITEKLNVNSITYRLDKKEYDSLNDAFLKAGLPDADITNDIAMTKLMYDAAHKYGIKYILNGHDFKREGSTPAKWTYMDAKYIRSVYTRWTGKVLKNYPLLTFWDQVYYGFIGIKNVRPFHFRGISDDEVRGEAMTALVKMGWKSYGAKHCENIYTEFVGSYLLPEKFNIDKRIVYLSAQIREGKLLKATAKGILRSKSPFDLYKLGKRRTEILELAASPIGSRSEYAKYDFKKWWFVIWILAKLKVVPYTFFKKYAQ